MGGAVTILTLPRLGETMEEAKVTEWLVAPGASFERGDVLLEVETDKTVVEVPALQSGTMVAHLVEVGDTVELGAPIAEVSGEGVAAKPVPAPEVEEPAPKAETVTEMRRPDARRRDEKVAASPRARRLAKAAGLALSSVPGTGRRGRVTGADVEAHASGTGAATGGETIALRRIESPGGGAPVLMLHGLFDHGAGWRDLPDRIAARGHPVLVADLPGHGDSAPVDSLAAAVDALARVLPDGPVILAGHSLGAVLAARLARRLGSRAARLVLFAPAGLGPRIDADFIDIMGHADTPEALARGIARLGSGPVSATALVAELARLKRGRAGMQALARLAARDGIQQCDIAADLAALKCPISALFGLRDAILPWQDCAALPARAAIHLAAGAGHLPQFDDTEFSVDLIAARQGAPVQSGAA